MKTTSSLQTALAIPSSIGPQDVNARLTFTLGNLPAAPGLTAVFMQYRIDKVHMRIYAIQDTDPTNVEPELRWTVAEDNSSGTTATNLAGAMAIAGVKHFSMSSGQPDQSYWFHKPTNFASGQASRGYVDTNSVTELWFGGQINIHVTNHTAVTYNANAMLTYYMSFRGVR